MNPKVPAGVRLQRVMAEAGVASRRECEQIIESGRVEVNGQTVSKLPVFVQAGDRISVDGRFLKTPSLRGPERGREKTTDRVYVMLNKPERTLTTTLDKTDIDEGGRRTVMDLIDHPSGARLYPVGRLDFNTTGLVLLTNDGELTNRLTHARYEVSQTYRIWIAGEVNEETLKMLRRRVGKRDEVDEEGVATGGVRIAIRKGEELETGTISGATVLEVTLRQGKREPLADMLLACGCRVKRMARVAVGTLRMKQVKVGEWRDLTKSEVQELRDSAGLGLEGQRASSGSTNAEDDAS